MEAKAPFAMARQKIFIFDDSQPTLEIVAAALRNVGFEVGVTHEVANLVASVKTFDPDLFLLDVVLPQGFSYDLIARIREALRDDCPLILFSALSEHTLQEKVKKYGASGYIQKDRDITALPEAVKQFLPRC